MGEAGTSIDALAGASTGALKGLSLATSSFANFTPISALQPSEDEILRLAWTGPSQMEALVARMDRSLSLFDSASHSLRRLCTVEGGEGPIRGLDTSPANARIVTGLDSGLVRTLSTTGEPLDDFPSGGHLQALRLSPIKTGCLATGGRESFLRLWDLERPQTPTFTAKNVKPDALQLRRPVFVRCMEFLPESAGLVGVGTGHAQLRVYDPRAQRRPVMETEWLDSPFSAVAAPSPHLLAAANAKGQAGLFDLRAKARLLHVFRGAAGGIRSLQAHPSAPLLLSAGADRFLRLHHLHSRQLLRKIYCKVPLNAALMRDELSILDSDGCLSLDSEAPKAKAEVKEEKEEVKDSDDDVWEGLEAVGEARPKRRRRMVKAEEEGQSKRPKPQPRPKREKGSPPAAAKAKKPRKEISGPGAKAPKRRKLHGD